MGASDTSALLARKRAALEDQLHGRDELKKVSLCLIRTLVIALQASGVHLNLHRSSLRLNGACGSLSSTCHPRIGRILKNMLGKRKINGPTGISENLWPNTHQSLWSHLEESCVDLQISIASHSLLQCLRVQFDTQQGLRVETQVCKQGWLSISDSRFRTSKQTRCQPGIKAEAIHFTLSLIL